MRSLSFVSALGLLSSLSAACAVTPGESMEEETAKESTAADHATAAPVPRALKTETSIGGATIIGLQIDAPLAFVGLDHNTYCVNVPNDSATPGTTLEMGPCGADAASFGFFQGTDNQFTLNVNDLCMDVYGGSTSAGAVMDEWTCAGSANQTFMMNPLANDSWQIVAKNSGLCLTAPTTTGSAMTQEACLPAGDLLISTQVFQPFPAGGSGNADYIMNQYWYNPHPTNFNAVSDGNGGHRASLSAAATWCQTAAALNGVVAYQSWGSLTDPSLQAEWGQYDCDAYTGPFQAGTRRETCMALGWQYGIIPHVTWGTLTDSGTQEWYGANNCDCLINEEIYDYLPGGSGGASESCPGPGSL